ncbi:MAG: hypothetical protein WB626_05550 [Bacteroidota bacterium]
MTNPVHRGEGPAAAAHRPGAERILDLVSMAALAFQVFALVNLWGEIPERVPLSFGPDGLPFAAGSRLLLLAHPVLGGVLFAGFGWLLGRAAVLPPPAGGGPDLRVRARVLLALLRAELIAVPAFLLWMSLLTAMGYAEGAGVWFLPLCAAVVLPSAGLAIHTLGRAARGGVPPRS